MIEVDSSAPTIPTRKEKHAVSTKSESMIKHVLVRERGGQISGAQIKEDSDLYRTTPHHTIHHGPGLAAA
jgi:hypothetical protein